MGSKLGRTLSVCGLALLANLSSARAAPATTHVFDAPEGTGISGVLLTAAGATYVTLTRGGTHNLGTIVRLDRDAKSTVVHSFTGAEGSQPMAALVSGRDAALYGTTSAGGQHGLGTLFRLDSDCGDPSGVRLTVLHHFSAQDGGAAVSSLTLSADGSLYMTTSSSMFRWSAEGVFTLVGPWTPGNVFRLDKAGKLTVCQTPSLYPLGSLVEGPDGALYGTAGLGVFRILPDCSDLSFIDQSSYPQTGLAVDATGHFYFNTYDGLMRLTLDSPATLIAPIRVTSPAAPTVDHLDDLDDQGAIWIADVDMLYRVDAAQQLTTQHRFGFENGQTLQDLVAAADGNFYGIATIENRPDNTRLFKLTRSGEYSVLLAPEFSGGLQAAPVMGPDRALYGVTYRRTADRLPSGEVVTSDGTAFVYRLSSSGEYTELYRPSVPADPSVLNGVLPQIGITPDGILVGVMDGWDGLYSSAYVFRLNLATGETHVAYAGESANPVFVASDGTAYYYSGGHQTPIFYLLWAVEPNGEPRDILEPPGYPISWFVENSLGEVFTLIHSAWSDTEPEQALLYEVSPNGRFTYTLDATTSELPFAPLAAADACGNIYASQRDGRGFKVAPGGRTITAFNSAPGSLLQGPNFTVLHFTQSAQADGYKRISLEALLEAEQCACNPNTP